MVTVRITSHQDVEAADFVYEVSCGNTTCKETKEYRYSFKKAPIDVYNTFVDDFAKTGV